MESEFKRVDTSTTMDTYMATHSFVGGSYRDGVDFGVRHPIMSLTDALKKLRKRYGSEDKMS
jgi:hypothetical protein